MSARITAEICVGIASFLTTMTLGYVCWRGRQRLQKRFSTVLPPNAANPQAIVPVLGGISVGLVLICLFAGKIVPDDQFYSVGAAISASLAVLAGGLLVSFGHFLLLTSWIVFAGLSSGSEKGDGAGRLAAFMRWKWITYAAPLLLASMLVAAAGVHFRVLGIASERNVQLGMWGPTLTVAWLIIATLVVQLLTGIEGAANVLLLVVSAAVFYSTLGTREHYLNAVTVAVMASSLASLRFNFFPARLSLTAGGTGYLGFVFAVLTVMARQKTVAALLLVFPLALVVILIGGAMLGLLERTMSADSDDAN